MKFDFRSKGEIVTGRAAPVVATGVTAGVTGELAEASETAAGGVTPGVTTGVTSVPAGASTVEASRPMGGPPGTFRGVFLRVTPDLPFPLPSPAAFLARLKSVFRPAALTLMPPWLTIVAIWSRV